MKKNIIQKIWDNHVVSQQPGHPAVLAIDLMLLHEVTSAQAFTVLKEKNLQPYRPERLVATIDHSIPTRKDREVFFDAMAKKQVDTLRENCKTFGVRMYDYDSQHQGIVHVIGPELGVTQPGLTIICGDSHTSTHGAFGALAFGVGTTEVGHALAAGAILTTTPKTMKVEFNGQLRPGVSAKDLVMKLIAEIGFGGGTGYVIEYTGEAIRRLSMEERMTVCNMSIECGARAGLIAPDETTFNYLKGRPDAPGEAHWQRAVSYWQSLCSDEGCEYDKVISVDISALKPMVTWGTAPSQAIEIDATIPTIASLDKIEGEMAKAALDYIGLQENQPMAGVPIDWAFLGSCTNSRIEDLRIAAKIMQGKKIADTVTMYVVPGSEAVMQQAKEEGLDKIFEEAGAQFRMPGCSMCIGMNDDKVPAGQRCISTSNRNFVGRQGPGSRTHLASPATVAVSALAGKIVSPLQVEVN